MDRSGAGDDRAAGTVDEHSCRAKGGADECCLRLVYGRWHGGRLTKRGTLGPEEAAHPGEFAIVLAPVAVSFLRVADERAE